MLRKAGYKGKYLGWYYLDLEGYQEIGAYLNLDIKELTKIVEVPKYKRIYWGLISRIHYKLFRLRYWNTKKYK